MKVKVSGYRKKSKKHFTNRECPLNNVSYVVDVVY